ncbi:transposase [Legionella beliardensis]|uniref:transposase n=1 Tax=Legionella beliardensis TaxID=91822 RepID=UPI001F5EC7D2|nr:transposase [Legionella beliardensis]
MKKKGNLAPQVRHLQIKYRNNRLESDYGKLKRLINSTLPLNSMVRKQLIQPLL